MQLEGRDYTDPAFSLEFGVADDHSEVTLSCCIGTFSGGCDVVADMKLGGESSIIARVCDHDGNQYDTEIIIYIYVLTVHHCQIVVISSEVPWFTHHFSIFIHFLLISLQ